MTTMSAVRLGAVVFTDITGFTEYTALRGDAEALALLALQEELVRGVLPPDARVVKELGDGLLLWFPGACDALNTCLLLQQLFQAQAEERDVPLWVRIGMHWGRPAERGSDLVGNDVNIASRIVNVAAPGEVLLSRPLLDEVNGQVPDVAFEELGPVVLRGIPDPIPLYRVLRDEVSKQ